MQYQATVIIDKPLREVMMLFNNPSHLIHWNTDMEYKETLEGHLGEEGSVSRLILKTPMLPLNMEERVLKKDLPHCVLSEYTSQEVKNVVEHNFKKHNDTATEYTMKGNFSFANPMMQMMSPLLVNFFKMSAEKTVQQFKAFCEHNFYDEM
jgi:hypothetical protein